MEIGSLLAIAVIVTVITVLIRPVRPEIAVWLSVITGLVIIGRILPLIDFLVRTLTDIVARTKASPVYFSTVLKVVGIAYLTGFELRYAGMQGRGQPQENWNWQAR